MGQSGSRDMQATEETSQVRADRSQRRRRLDVARPRKPTVENDEFEKGTHEEFTVRVQSHHVPFMRSVSTSAGRETSLKFDRRTP